MYRKSYVEVDLDALIDNAKYFMKNTDKKLIGVIKANGYGLVDHMEAAVLKESGVDFFAVSSLDEALNLRRHGFTDKILILGYVDPDDLHLVREKDLSVVSVSKDYVEKADLKGIKVHLKLNTGMNRIGVRPDEAKEVLEIMKEKGAVVEGVMSHFSSADTDKEYSISQYKMFKDCVRSLDHEFRYIHMSATDASLIIDDDICNYHRVGLGLLGFSSYETELKPCIRLFSEVSMVKKLNKGDTVSYGRHYTSDGEGYVLTLPIGYADGFCRANTGKKVYVGNEYGTIIGSVCMDQLMVLTDSYHEVGTKVELYGDHISIVERAADIGTIVYELITGLSDRLGRVYIRDGKIVRMIDPRF
ncbi:MAG: alanine racemase [Oscillospiraceae bacterium]|nr:alanine racemase [Erysipelotrichaceae bacterium]MBQ6149288.1 alanine racemase [Oscillospiraceae bacterium]MBQ6494096.1 alanine racemase [Erysipelotrichaceae bacterium]